MRLNDTINLYDREDYTPEFTPDSILNDAEAYPEYDFSGVAFDMEGIARAAGLRHVAILGEK